SDGSNLHLQPEQGPLRGGVARRSSDRDAKNSQCPLLWPASPSKRYLEWKRSCTRRSECSSRSSWPLIYRESRAAPRAPRQFALQRGAHFGTFSDVRMIVLSSALLTGIAATSAQEQGGK